MRFQAHRHLYGGWWPGLSEGIRCCTADNFCHYLTKNVTADLFEITVDRSAFSLSMDGIFGGINILRCSREVLTSPPLDWYASRHWDGIDRSRGMLPNVEAEFTRLVFRYLGRFAVVASGFGFLDPQRLK
jgi:hypothetical protein